MEKNEEKVSSNDTIIFDSRSLEVNEINAVKLFIKEKLFKKRKELQENDDCQIKKPLKIKKVINTEEELNAELIKDLIKPKVRNYFTCMMCIAFEFHDIFKIKNSEIIIGEFNYNEILIKFALCMLIKVYRNYFYKFGITNENPKIYPTFDFKQENIYNKISSEFNIITNDDYLENTRIGLHLSLTRNHHISKKLSITFLKNIIKKFNNCPTSIIEIPEKTVKTQKVEIQTNLKSFCIFIDYDSVIVLKNTLLFSKNTCYTNINGGIFVALKVHNSSKNNYLDPIIEIIDQTCIEIGIQPLYSERILHISLFYIKKSDLYLDDNNHNLQLNSKNLLETFSFKEYLKSKSSNISNNHFIWINQIIFRIGIYEYCLILKS